MNTRRTCWLAIVVAFSLRQAAAQPMDCSVEDSGGVSSVFIPGLGEKRTLIILYNFAPDPQGEDPSPPSLHAMGRGWTGSNFVVNSCQEAHSIVFDSRYPDSWSNVTVNDWFREVSDDRVRLTGHCIGYFTLPIDIYPRPGTPTGISTNDFLNAVSAHAIAAAQAAGYNIQYTGGRIQGDYDIALFVGPGVGGSSANGTGRAWLATLDARTVTHEIGHVFGLTHESGWDCGSNAVPQIGGDPACSRIEYANPFSVMGTGSGHISAFQKQQLGWLDATSVTEVLMSGTYLLRPQEYSGFGTRLLKIWRFTDGNYYHLEFRRPLGYDDNDRMNSCLSECSCGGCCGVFVILPHYQFSTLPMLLDMTPNSIPADFVDCGLLPGVPFVDEVNQICIMPLRVIGTGVDAALEVAIGCDLLADYDCNQNGIVDSVDIFNETRTYPKTVFVSSRMIMHGIETHE